MSVKTKILFFVKFDLSYGVEAAYLLAAPRFTINVANLFTKEPAHVLIS